MARLLAGLNAGASSEAVACTEQGNNITSDIWSN